MRPRIDLAFLCAALLTQIPTAFATETQPLRVCAQSDNFPLSDRQGRGFENKLAELVASKLDRRLMYVWWPARENFLDSTLNQGKCDVVMDVPAGLDGVTTTIPYYSGSYVLVSRAAAHLSFDGIYDRKLKHLKIGVYLIGDDQTPPALALSEQGINDNVRGYMTFFDRSGTGDSELISAVERGQLDVAAVWNPLVGYYVRRSPVPLTTTALNGAFRGLPFRYEIAMGVHEGNVHLKNELDWVVAGDRATIHDLLEDYGVLLSKPGEDVPLASRRSP